MSQGPPALPSSRFCRELISKRSLWPLTLFLSFLISWICCHLHQRVTHPQCRHRCPKAGTGRVTPRKEPVLTSSRDRFTQEDDGGTFKIIKNWGRTPGFNHIPNKGGSIKRTNSNRAAECSRPETLWVESQTGLG